MKPLVVVLLLLVVWIAFEILLRWVRRSVLEASRTNPLAALLLAVLGGGRNGRPAPHSGGPTRGTAAGPRTGGERDGTAVEQLVRCRRCGIHVAERLSLRTADGTFCSAACRDAVPAG